MSRQPLKTLLIGCGKAAVIHELDARRKKPASLLGGMLHFPEKFILTGVCDINEKRGELVKEFIPGVKIFKDYKKALADIKPELAIIATWTNTHFEIFKACLRTGVKAIILEKPVATTLAQAQKMYTLWQKNPIPVIVNHERRWHPGYHLLKDIYLSAELGRIRAVYGKVLLSAVPEEWEKEVFELEGGGTLLHDGTHLIDILLFIFGQLTLGTAVQKMGRLLDQTTNAIFLANQNIPVYFEVGGERSYFEFSLTLEAEMGTVKIGNGIKEWWQTRESKLYTGYNDLVKADFPDNRLKDYIGCYNFAGPFFEIYQAVELPGSYNSASFRDGIKVLEIIAEIGDKALKRSIYDK